MGEWVYLQGARDKAPPRHHRSIFVSGSWERLFMGFEFMLDDPVELKKQGPILN